MAETERVQAEDALHLRPPRLLVGAHALRDLHAKDPHAGEDRRGEIVQSAGVTDAPGLYVVGLRFQTRRNSNFIDGVRHDARAVVDHLVSRRRDCVPVAV